MISKIGFLSTCILALTAIVNPCLAGQVVFDNLSNAENAVPGAHITATSSTPNTYMGEGYTLAAGTSRITGFDLVAVNVSQTTFSALKFDVSIWDTLNMGTVSAGAPAFSNLLGNYTFGSAAGNYGPGSYFVFDFTLPNAISLSDQTIGMSFNIKGSTDGVNFANVNGLTSGISYGTPASVGANVFNGYYRNANSETNGNFISGVRSLGLSNQSLAVRIHGDLASATEVPEPASYLIVGLGLAALALARRKAA